MTIVTPAGTNEGRGAAPLYVEVDDVSAPDGLDAVLAGDTRAHPAARVLEIAHDVYDEGLDLARRCAAQAAARLSDLGQGVTPDEVELQLAIKLDATLGAVLAKSGAEAQLQVTFRWKPGESA
jgi:Tfp pilus assembly protein PilF